MIVAPGNTLRTQLDRWMTLVRDAGLDGWLIADFRWNSPIFGRLLGLSEGVLTRRSFLWLPALGKGDPNVVLSRVDGHTVASLPLPVTQYGGFDDMRSKLQALLGAGSRVAMEYSPDGRLPTISRVDAGLIEMIRGLGVEVVSSGTLVSSLEIWTERQQDLHRQAARVVDDTRRKALNFCFERIAAGREITEGELADFISRAFQDQGMTAGGTPDVAVNDHSADPHYSSAGGPGAVIGPDSILLIDLWCRSCESDDAPFADSTWMAYTGSQPPSDYLHVFDVTAGARNAAIECLAAGASAQGPVRGADVDRHARDVVRQAGLESHLIHRTGHSLGTDHTHGMGTNLDAVEFPDERPILTDSGFTVEPGLYLPDRFGVRLEVSAIMKPQGPEITTEVQRAVTTPHTPA